jgi:UPF0716 protein FxsA
VLFKLFLLFTLAPAIELAILIYAGTKLGTLNTLSIVILTALAGSILVRKEGLDVLNRFRLSLEGGIFPSEEIMDGAMILVAGALLLTPGFITDIIGLAFVLPASREMIKPLIKSYINRKFIALGRGSPGGPDWP